MDYDELEALRRGNAARRLLRADNVALIPGFLGRVFVDENVPEIRASELTARMTSSTRCGSGSAIALASRLDRRAQRFEGERCALSMQIECSPVDD